jgi:hypothetical protein
MLGLVHDQVADLPVLVGLLANEAEPTKAQFPCILGSDIFPD